MKTEEKGKYVAKLKQDDFLAAYRWMYLSRRTEEAMVELHRHTPVTELPHAGIGQEATMVGSCFNLRRTDQVMPAHRSRGVFLAKGISSRHMMAGAYGKDIPYVRGKNTSHHLGSVELGVVTGTGCIGSQFPLAVGFALGMKMQGRDDVMVVYCGDGATNRGDFHESLNLASIYDLPVVFLVENNQYAISTPVAKSMRVKDISTRAIGYGMPGVTVDGNDFCAVYEVAQRAVERARQGLGPTLVECKTYRHKAHSERDPRDLRPPDEIREWLEKDPIPRMRNYLLENGYATRERIDEIDKSVAVEVEDAVEYAKTCPYPPVDILTTNVYV